MPSGYMLGNAESTYASATIEEKARQKALATQ
jgi:hypothetical protein